MNNLLRNRTSVLDQVWARSCLNDWRLRAGTRLLVVSDPFNAGRVELLGLPGKVAVFGTVKPEPDIPNLAALLSMAAEVQPDIVIGFGGGSAMDLAKLAGVLPGSGQTIHDVVGAEKVRGRKVALVQVPTTSGTGSEAGTRALVTDPATQKKHAVQSSYMLADLAVVDPDLTLTVPPAVTAATGVKMRHHDSPQRTAGHGAARTVDDGFMTVGLVFLRLQRLHRTRREGPEDHSSLRSR